MKLKTTLTTQQLNDLLLNKPAGIFTSLLSTEDSFYHLGGTLSFDYYLSRSGNKTVAPLVETLITINNDYEAVNRSLGIFLRNKYIDKWSRIYEALVVANYEVLTDYQIEKLLSGNDTDIKTFTADNNLSTDTNSTTTYNTQVDNNVATAIKEVTTFENQTQDKTFGFNSYEAVDKDLSTDNNTQTVTGSKDDNVSVSNSSKSGTDTKGDKIKTLDAKNEKHNNTFDTTRNTTINGRHTSNAELLEKELQLRNDNIFIDIVLKDIDNELTLDIYTED